LKKRKLLIRKKSFSFLLSIVERGNSFEMGKYGFDFGTSECWFLKAVVQEALFLKELLHSLL